MVSKSSLDVFRTILNQESKRGENDAGSFEKYKMKKTVKEICFDSNTDADVCFESQAEDYSDTGYVLQEHGECTDTESDDDELLVEKNLEENMSKSIGETIILSDILSSVGSPLKYNNATHAEHINEKVDNNKVSKIKQKRIRKRYLTINVSSCKYECVRRVSKRFGFREVEDGEDWTLYWTDLSVGLERVLDMKKYQKINHYPGMSEICRKDLLARNMNRLWKQFPKDYAIFPRTWCLPADFGDFQAFCRSKINKTFILKPDSGSQGKGIYLTKNPKDVKPGEDLICQQYVSKPFLIDGFKFDLRIYVLVTSCDPLRIFVFEDGLARFSTVRYVEPTNSNLENVFMHLTNYAIQKNSGEFIRDEESGSKRRLTVINKWFKDNNYDVANIWSSIDDVIIKTLISAHPTLKHNYRTCFSNHIKSSACFEILGFDVILDRNLKPWILEVNHSPSFTTDSKLDREIKDSLVHDTLVLVNFSLCNKRRYIEEERRRVRERLLQKPKDQKDKKEEGDLEKEKEEKEKKEKEKEAHFLNALKKYEDSHIGNFRRIYPENNEKKYEEFFSNSCSLFQETASSKARSECARLQREQIKQKNEFIEKMRKKNGSRNIESADGLRPESGGGASQVRKTLLKRLTKARDLKVKKNILYDSLTTYPINEHDELERIGGTMQRANLLKTRGIPDIVNRLLQGTKTMIGKNFPGPYDKENDKSSEMSKSLPTMGTFSTFNDHFQERSTSHWNKHVGSNLSNNQMFNSLSNRHWPNSVPPSWSRRNHKVFVSPGINFTSLVRPKVSPKRDPFAKVSNTKQPENDCKTIMNFDNDIIDSINRIDYTSFEKNNIMSRQSLCSMPRSSPPLKLFKNGNEDAERMFAGERGLSVTCSPVPLQIREDSLLRQSDGSVHQNRSLRGSTRSQRIRGARNNMRIKQMELLKSRTIVPG